jgi:hypothetical protein
VPNTLKNNETVRIFGRKICGLELEHTIVSEQEPHSEEETLTEQGHQQIKEPPPVKYSFRETNQYPNMIPCPNNNK